MNTGAQAAGTARRGDAGTLVNVHSPRLEGVNVHQRPRLPAYSIQGDHAHFVVEATGREALGRGMKSLGARLARAVNRVFKRKGPVLRDRYHLRVMRTPMEVKNGLRYVLLNARRHARKPSQVLRVDPASSGRWFDGWKRKTSDARRPARAQAVAPARTWLLGKGWRRHGLIDPLEVPG